MDPETIPELVRAGTGSESVAKAEDLYLHPALRHPDDFGHREGAHHVRSVRKEIGYAHRPSRPIAFSSGVACRHSGSAPGYR